MGKNRFGKAIYVILLMMYSLFAVSCAGDEPTQDAFTPDRPVAVETEPDKLLRIISDRTGYECNEEKIIYVKDGTGDGRFILKKTETDEVVFIGELRPAEGAGDDTYIADISQIRDEGIYLLRAGNDISRKLITIHDDHLDLLYRNSLETLENTKAPDDRSGYYRLAVMLLAGDIYSDGYVDWAYINREIGKAVSREEILLNEPNGINEDNVSDRLTAAAVLAEYYSIYGDVEPDKVTDSADVALRLYEAAEEYKDHGDPTALYFADSCLNRATGRDRFRKGIEAYDRETAPVSEYHDFGFIADIMYLRSRNVGKPDKCDNLIRSYLDTAMSVSAQRENLTYGMNADIDIHKASDEIMICVLADKILSKEIYRQVRLDHIHYLNGGNPEGRDLLKESETDITLLSKLVFIMGDPQKDSDDTDERTQ